MTRHPSLIPTNTAAAARRLSRFCAAHPHHQPELKGLILWIRLAAQQIERDEAVMSFVAEALRFERSEKEKAQKFAADLQTALNLATANGTLDADDAAEVEKTRGEMPVVAVEAAPEVTPAA